MLPADSLCDPLTYVYIHVYMVLSFCEIGELHTVSNFKVLPEYFGTRQFINHKFLQVMCKQKLQKIVGTQLRI